MVTVLLAIGGIGVSAAHSGSGDNGIHVGSGIGGNDVGGVVSNIGNVVDGVINSVLASVN